MSTDSNGSTEARAINEIAGDWLARRDAGDWGAAEQTELERWLGESTAHRVAFLRLELAWEKTGRLKALGAGVPSDVIPPPGEWTLSPFFGQSDVATTLALPAPRAVMSAPAARRAVRKTLLPWAAAAAIALMVGIYAFNAGLLGSDRYSTPIGGVASVPVSDGSKVTLNTDSRIRLTITATERRIRLEQGEAFFEVAKDPTRPFVVEVGDKQVIAVGTRFSVRREGQEMRVVVTEGRVRIEPAGQSSGVVSGTLAAGTVARANDSGTLVQKKPLTEVEEYLSWRSGVLMFRDATLYDAVAEFNRYNERKIVIDDPAISAMRVAGGFRSTNVEAFVRLLERGYPLRTRAGEGGSIHLSSR